MAKEITMTTECYAELDGRLLMLHRVKKEQDINKDKWIGVGGHLEFGESPEEGIRRELAEETGMTADRMDYRGVITFVYGEVTEIIFLFTARGLRDSTGQPVDLQTELPDCDEGVLAWVLWEEVGDLPIWEGDRVFLELLRKETRFFSVKLIYDADDTLIRAIVNEKETDLKKRY
ncbi:MAG: NUDIX domain-containing protein [Lachnospiraceae bacterium]|nr:NUDIX domain-containing protein [Lachnospiraceae bacterium]